jgi:hypothetical protein
MDRGLELAEAVRPNLPALEAEVQEKTDTLIARVISDEASRKAERDQRYANRKARQYELSSCRSTSTRPGKLAMNVAAVVQLAAPCQYLRTLRL